MARSEMREVRCETRAQEAINESQKNENQEAMPRNGPIIPRLALCR
jgi:hypothetical protein